MNSVENIGKSCYQNSAKVSGDLFVLTYGALVTQILEDFQNDVTKTNDKLKELGKDIGYRLVDELLAVTQIKRCAGIEVTIDILANIGFKLFLGVVPTVTNDLSSNVMPTVDFKNINLSKNEDETFKVDSVSESIPKTITPASKEYYLSFEENPLERFVSLPKHLEGLKFSNVLCGIVESSLELLNIEAKCDISPNLNNEKSTCLKVNFIRLLDDIAGEEYREE